MEELIKTANTELNIQDEPGELIQISQAMLADARADLNKASTRSISIVSLSSLGVALHLLSWHCER